MSPTPNNPIPGPEPRAFICHASQDSDAAGDICDQLLDAGCGVWLDKRCLIPGQNFEYEIRNAIAHTDATIVVLSKNSVDKTGFLQRELRLALKAADERPDGSIFIVPVRLDDVPVPAGLSKWHWVDAREDGWISHVLHSLRRACRQASLNLITPSGAVDSDIISLRPAPLTLQPGGLLTLDYAIELRTSYSVPVEIGASLLDPTGQEFHDRRGDRRLLLRPGTSVYRRQLRLPMTIPTAEYVLIGASWLNSIGAGLISRIKCAQLIRVAM